MPESFSPNREGFSFADLGCEAGLARLDARFLQTLQATEPALHVRLEEYRAGAKLDAKQTSALLLALAPHLQTLLVRLFDLHEAVAASRAQTEQANIIPRFAKEFVQRAVRRHRSETDPDFAELCGWLQPKLGQPPATIEAEAVVAALALRWLEDPDANQENLRRLTQWCAQAQTRSPTQHWRSFQRPAPVDFDHLVPLVAVPGDDAQRRSAPTAHLRQRDGFALTDPRMDRGEIQAQVHYCVFCHKNAGDYCSRGFPEKKGDAKLKTNPLGVMLTGCPLDEKISEMHILKRDGHTLAALAMAMVDNPMIPATGHRICNDCMKACIYQKQEPVNIPQIETRVLTDVLRLPWGVEIYVLLTRWNPLRRSQYLPAAETGYRVLISGMGPAGFTMAHHLTMEGHTVIGSDGLKIEPLPAPLVQAPVRDYHALEESLDERILAGFGGVAEYGITVRWDKNFLKLIYLALARRANFRVFGGVRLGGTLTLEDAWQCGFHHVVIASGAGLPKVIPMVESLARGIRQASDFLMALQLTGAAKKTSLASLQLRLPAVVIGGGLTAVDTATEVQAYYITQVEKTLHRYECLVAEQGERAVRNGLDEEHNQILDEFLAHGQAVRVERRRAKKQGVAPNLTGLLRSWGGVTLTYRRRLKDSPAYVRNHEEIAKAMEEGIYYADGLEPLRAELDRFGHVQSLVCRRRGAQPEEVSLPARAVFVAAGAFPNTIYEREYPGTFALDGRHFHPAHNTGKGIETVPVAEHCKAPLFGPFTSYENEQRRVSFIGDTHPVFHGSVVKAIASAKRSYPEISRALHDLTPKRRRDNDEFCRDLSDLLTPRVHSVDNSHPAMVEIRVRAPMAARSFKPGQFFRLQTFESLAPVVVGTRLQVPLQTVSGAGVEGDLVRLIVLRFGANPRLLARLKPGEPVVLMGPTGAPADLHADRTILLVAGKWGAAVTLDLGRAWRQAGSRVLMIGAFRDAAELYHQDELEAACDQILWCTTHGAPIHARRPQDLSLVEGNVVEVLRRYGEDPGTGIALDSVDEVLVMGSTGLLRGLQKAFRGVLNPLFKPNVEFLGTVGSPMQCMLKGVCAQCLQWQIDPHTGQRTVTEFSCARQDQPLFAIDLENLAARQAQNRLPDHLTNLWVDYALRHLEHPATNP